MRLFTLEELPDMPDLKLAVVGHVEWVTFLKVDRIAQPGCISHATTLLEEPAGGGAVAAVELTSLVKSKVHFFTALGKDFYGERSLQRLEEL